ncbi:hypothetical protein [Streptomyces mutabilis]|uniref:hypothetical protein n=1 Tax=Streptomyces mutabilis TaxID=67332 RepID=UPI0011465283|nr:hypothetical protein [Streptomyces mutabilis]
MSRPLVFGGDLALAPPVIWLRTAGRGWRPFCSTWPQPTRRRRRPGVRTRASRRLAADSPPERQDLKLARDALEHLVEAAFTNDEAC